MFKTLVQLYRKLPEIMWNQMTVYFFHVKLVLVNIKVKGRRLGPGLGQGLHCQGQDQYSQGQGLEKCPLRQLKAKD